MDQVCFVKHKQIALMADRIYIPKAFQSCQKQAFLTLSKLHSLTACIHQNHCVVCWDTFRIHQLLMTYSIFCIHLSQYFENHYNACRLYSTHSMLNWHLPQNHLMKISPPPKINKIFKKIGNNTNIIQENNHYYANSQLWEKKT